ncbi:MAG: hydroxyethylthiazole kinase [Thermoanaerobacteraceae bacterium]
MSYNFIKELRNKRPLIHHITNVVTVNDCANITLAVGALPVMAEALQEVEEMVSEADALVLNIGTLSDIQIESMIRAGKAANFNKKPIILDPVGVGATKYRTESVQKILSNIKVSVIKGNSAEISILAGESGKIKGVESLKEINNISFSAKKLAKIYSCVVAVSGAVDIVTDGEKIYYIKNGDPIMGTITGTGCMLSSVVGSFCGSWGNFFEATVEAITAFGIAGQKASRNINIKGPGSFKLAFFDEMYLLTDEDIKKEKNIQI